MKRDNATINELLNQSDFRWNPLAKMVEITCDDVWDAYDKVLC